MKSRYIYTEMFGNTTFHKFVPLFDCLSCEYKEIVIDNFAKTRTVYCNKFNKYYEVSIWDTIDWQYAGKCLLGRWKCDL